MQITYPKRHCQILRLWGTESESYNLCGKMLGEVESVQPTFFKQADRLANMTHLLLSIWRRNIKEPAHVSAPTEDTRSYETSHTAFALMLRYNNNQPIRYNTVTSLIGGRVEKIVKPASLRYNLAVTSWATATCSSICRLQNAIRYGSTESYFPLALSSDALRAIPRKELIN
jgi:hypothetical protein